jgi:hypothetical protein
MCLNAEHSETLLTVRYFQSILYREPTCQCFPEWLLSISSCLFDMGLRKPNGEVVDGRRHSVLGATSYECSDCPICWDDLSQSNKDLVLLPWYVTHVYVQ